MRPGRSASGALLLPGCGGSTIRRNQRMQVFVASTIPASQGLACALTIGNFDGASTAATRRCSHCCASEGAAPRPADLRADRAKSDFFRPAPASRNCAAAHRDAARQARRARPRVASTRPSSCASTRPSRQYDGAAGLHRRHRSPAPRTLRACRRRLPASAPRRRLRDARRRGRNSASTRHARTATGPWAPGSAVPAVRDALARGDMAGVQSLGRPTASAANVTRGRRSGGTHAARPDRDDGFRTRARWGSTSCG